MGMITMCMHIIMLIHGTWEYDDIRILLTFFLRWRPPYGSPTRSEPDFKSRFAFFFNEGQVVMWHIIMSAC